jgi:hypothetical protein
MTERSLQVTYRKGRAFAAYLHLSHPTGEKSAKTSASSDGLLVVDQWRSKTTSRCEQPNFEHRTSTGHMRLSAIASTGQ